MFLTQLDLTDFRNYQRLTVDFESHKIILLGNNAQGKTTLLEAVNLLSTGKGLVANRDADMVRWGASQAVIRSKIKKELTDLSIDMLLRVNGRRAVKIDGLHQRRLADIFGKLLVVLFRSDDLELVRGGPATRRDYLDLMLMQLSGTYYQCWHDYQRVLAQRNALLRSLAEGRDSDAEVAHWDDALIRLGIQIWRWRQRLITAIAGDAAERYLVMSDHQEQLTLRYLPSMPLDGDVDTWSDRMATMLTSLRRREIARRQSLLGPHRDDLELLLNDRPARLFASQGQQRSIVLALKLAELSHLQRVAQEAPILLLDDVLAELDVKRQNALLNAIGDDIQTLVTTTHLNDFSAQWLRQAAIYHVSQGSLTRDHTNGYTETR